MTQVFYVNGYGVPKDILTDENYGRYLQACLDRIRTASSKDGTIRLGCQSFGGAAAIQNPELSVYLAGGATDPLQPDKTEAGEMGRLLDGLLIEDEGIVIDVHLIDRSLDLQGNLEELQRQLQPNDRVTIFCEHARQDWMRYLARQMFGHRATVIPIRFDTAETLLCRPRQWPGLLVKAAGYHCPPFKRLTVDRLRRRHMERAARS